MPGQSIHDPLREWGEWAYVSGVSGTVNLAAGRRVVGIAATSADGGSLTINGGNSIGIPAGKDFAFEPRGNLGHSTATTLIFDSTDSYVVEYVA